MSPFEFFFTFYGLILGLAAAELLNGLGGLVRERKLSRIGPQTALLSLVLMACILLTWLDAWTTYQGVTLNLATLTGPLLVAGCYYLAAVVIFPKNLDEWASMDAYYADRKRFTVGLILVAEVVLILMFMDRIGVTMLEERPLVFWRWMAPYNVLIHALLIALFFARGRRANLILLVGLLFTYALPYWTGGMSEFVESF